LEREDNQEEGGIGLTRGFQWQG